MFNALRHSLSGSAPAGRETPVLPAPGDHPVLGAPLDGPWPEGSRVIYLAAGCFWGVERILWRQDGIVSTSVGYMGGQEITEDVPDGVKVFSPDAPLGQALMGHRAGDTVSYEAPNGRKIQAEIVKVERV